MRNWFCFTDWIKIYNMRKYILQLALFIFASSISFGQIAKIPFKIKGLADTSVILAYHYGEQKYIADTIKIDKTGNGLIQSDTLIDGGIYLIITPKKKYFEFLLGDDQKFSMETDTSNLTGNLTFKGSDENQNFVKYQKFMAETQAKALAFRDELKLYQEKNIADSVSSIEKRMDKIDDDVSDFRNKMISDNPNTLLANVLSAMAFPKLDDIVVPENCSNPDSLRWVMTYIYNKNHFLDGINFNDERLLKTPVFQGKIDHFFSRMLLQIPDSLKLEVDKVVERASVNDKMYQYILVHLLDYYNKTELMGLDEMFVYVTERYYLGGKAPWSTPDFLKKLDERIIKIKPTMLGNIAPELEIPTFSGEPVSLQHIEADYTIVAFWEPNCGHCKTVIPQLHEMYKKYETKNIQVLAVNTQISLQEWTDFIEKNKLTDWINAWDPHRFSNFNSLYNITHTPTLFLLDKNKKIIAKRISVETIDDIIKTELKL